MLKRLSLVTLGMGLIAATASGQTPAAKSACRFVTLDEAAAILGSRPEMSERDQQCDYVVPKQSMRLAVRFEDYGGIPPSIFLGFPRKSADPNATQDEPSLGQAAFSTRTPTSIDIYVGAKTLLIHVGILEADGKSVPASMLDKLRDVAKKAMGRI